MRHGFIIGRLVTSQQLLAGLVKFNHQQLFGVEVSLNEKISFVYSLNRMVLFLYGGKTIDHNYYIENSFRPVVKEIWKQTKSVGTEGIKLTGDNA